MNQTKAAKFLSWIQGDNFDLEMKNTKEKQTKHTK